MHPRLTTNKVESEGACIQYTSFAKTIRFILSKKKIKCCVVINEININAFTERAFCLLKFVIVLANW